ncbi:MAG: acyl carrier protein [Acidobacteriota bacterium]
MADIKEELLAFMRDKGRDTSAPDILSRPLRDIIDSVDMVEFLLFIEESFDLTIDDNDVTPETFHNLDSVATFVNMSKQRTAFPDRAVRGMDMEVKRIHFEELKHYWIEVDHFKKPDKKIREVVRVLGPYACTIDDPRRESYGLFRDGKMIGGTHLVQWDARWLRYRTLNVREPYRGPDLGWILLRRAINLDWQDWKVPDRYLFGWIRRPHVPWSLAHGFKKIGGRWHEDHLGMIRTLSDL